MLKYTLLKLLISLIARSVFQSRRTDIHLFIDSTFPANQLGVGDDKLALLELVQVLGHQTAAEKLQGPKNKEVLLVYQN